MGRKTEYYTSSNGNRYKLESTVYGGGKIYDESGRRSSVSCNDNYASKRFIEEQESSGGKIFYDGDIEFDF